jgi:LysM repeat protein
MKYTVKSGDNLSSIGAKLGVSWTSIANANGIKPPYRIYPNQVLEVPTGGTGGVVTAGPQPYNGQPLSPISSSNSGGSALPSSFSEPMALIINATVVYGLYRVLMKVF